MPSSEEAAADAAAVLRAVPRPRRRDPDRGPRRRAVRRWSSGSAGCTRATTDAWKRYVEHLQFAACDQELRRELAAMAEQRERELAELSGLHRAGRAGAGEPA